jgi:uncharacterized protein involved in exopolysaccharide biosynthesis
VTPSANQAELPESAVLRLIRLLVRGRWLLTLAPVAAFIACLVLTHWRMTYSAEAILRPESASQGANRLGTIVAQFGVVLPNAPIGDPLRFQAGLLETRAVLGPVVTSLYSVAATPGAMDSTRGTFLDLLHIKGGDLDDRTLHGIDRLKKLVSVETDATAGLITIRVTTRWPELSLALTQRLISVLEIANNIQQQAAAEAEAHFAAGQLAQGRAVLDSAEGDLERFLEQNRQYENSPTLVLRYGRLQRRIDLAQAVVTSLAQAYEQARIDAARDTPVVSIVDSPTGSVREAGRPVRDGVVWAVIVLGLVLMLILGRDALQRAYERRPEQMAGILAEFHRASTINRHD